MNEDIKRRLQELYTNYYGKKKEMHAYSREYLGITFVVLLTFYSAILYHFISPVGWMYLIVFGLSLVLTLLHILINYWIFKPYFARIYEYCEILDSIEKNIRKVENEDPDLYLQNMILHR